MCAGKNRRWNEEYPKSLAEFKNEPNILRTVRLLNRQNISNDNILVTVNENNKSFFPKNLNLKLGSSDREIDRFRNVFDIIDNYDKVIFLYGDVLYSEDDLIKILSTEDYCFFGRSGKNPITNKLHGEILGLTTNQIENFKNDVNQVALKFERGILSRELGWEVFWNNKKNKFIELSFYTDDYDSIKEYDIISKNLI
jgi:hypothetical protein